MGIEEAIQRKLSRRMRGGFVLCLAAASYGQNVVSAHSENIPRVANVSVINFAIPSQSVDSALSAFSRVTGIQIVSKGAATRGITSPGVRGNLGAKQALLMLLAGTDLVPQFVDANTVAVTGPDQAHLGQFRADASANMVLDTIDVQGNSVNPSAVMGNLPPVYAGGQVATGAQLGLLGNRSILDTPFNVTSYTKEYLQNVQAHTLADAVQNSPSVRVTQPNSSFADSLTIRGFPVLAYDVTYGGVGDVLPRRVIPAELAERIEILYGPNALLNGISPFGNVGGSINVVPKRAEDIPLTQITLGYVSKAQFGTAIDVGRRFGQDNAFGVRVNAVFRDGDTALDHSRQQFGLGSVGLDYRGDRFRLSADFGYEANRLNDPPYTYTTAAGFPIPAAPKAESNPLPTWNKITNYDAFGVLRGEFDLAPDWTVSGAIGGKRDDLTYMMSNPTITNSLGNLAIVNQFYPQNEEALSAQVGLRGRLQTGPFRHDLAVNAAHEYEIYNQLAVNGATIASGSNLYFPRYVAPQVFPVLPDYLNLPKNTVQNLSSLAFADTISMLDDRIQLIGGGREQQVESSNYSSSTGFQTARNDQTRFSPAGAVVVKPWQNVSLYSNYIEGLSPGAVAPSTAINAGATFPPYVSRQVEAGLKVDFGRITGTFSAFQIEKPTGNLDATTRIFSVNAKQRNQGLEFQTFGELTDGVRLLGGISLIDGRITQSPQNVYNGHVAPGVPFTNINLGAEWDTPFVPGFTVLGRIVYSSTQYVDQANTQTIPDWTRIDLGARYTFAGYWGKPVVIRLNVQNVLDKGYWASSAFNGGNTLVRGEPRTFYVSTTFNF